MGLCLLHLIDFGCIIIFFIKMLGGFGNAQDEDDNVKALVKGMKDKAEAALGEKYSVFEAVKFKTQVVAGTNYLIKLKLEMKNNPDACPSRLF